MPKDRVPVLIPRDIYEKVKHRVELSKGEFKGVKRIR